MGKIVDAIIGNLEEKREYKKNEARAKALPDEYATAYKEIKEYIFRTSGITTMEPLNVLVDILEEAADNNKHVLEVTGSDVAAFADDLMRGQKTYQDAQRKKLNTRITNTSKKKDA